MATTYVTIPLISYTKCTFAHPTELPEVVHLEDPALTVMIDFENTKAPVVTPETRIDQVLEEMKISSVHLMMVADQNKNVIGLISTEDILGEKPIKILEERRINRGEITARMVMVPQTQIAAIDYDSLTNIRVGNIVNTLRGNHEHYVLVIQTLEKNQKIIRGLFSISQISKQLHMDLNNNFSKAETIAELQERQK